MRDMMQIGEGEFGENSVDRAWDRAYKALVKMAKQRDVKAVVFQDKVPFIVRIQRGNEVFGEVIVAPGDALVDYYASRVTDTSNKWVPKFGDEEQMDSLKAAMDYVLAGEKRENTMRETFKRLEEAAGGRVSASVQTSEPYLTYTQDGDRLVYTIWSWVSPYFGWVPARDSVYIHMQGRTPDGLEELIDRQRMLYGTGSSLMRFQGKEEQFPYTKGTYKGDTVDDIQKLKGTTVRLRDGKPAPISA